MARRPKPPLSLPQFPNRLREVRKRRGLSLAKLAERTRKPLSSVQRFEVGEYQLTLADAQRFASALQVDVMEILPGDESRLVDVVGRVGAGAQVYSIDDYAQGAVPFKVSCPPNLDPAVTVAVTVQGDSMPPLEDGWILFFSRVHDRPPSELINRLCIVKVADDGPQLVKQLRRGPDRGRYNLVSANAPLIENVELDWAARVTGMLPPDMPSS